MSSRRRRGGWRGRRGERRETGKEEKMKELQIENLASHDHPESCANARKDGGEALTGARTGWVLSPEIPNQGADALPFCGRQHAEARKSRVQQRPCGVEGPMHVRNLFAREPGDPRAAGGNGAAGRDGKAPAVILR